MGMEKYILTNIIISENKFKNQTILLKMLTSQLTRLATRSQAVKQAVRRYHAEEGPGNNIPFQIANKNRLLITMGLYFGTGFTIPFAAVRFQAYKKSIS